MTLANVASPGGWLNLLNGRIAARLVIGLLAVNGAVDAGQGLLSVYGTLQGQGAAHYVEVELSAVAAADREIISVLNPLPDNMTGAIVADRDSIVFIEETPAPVSTLDIGISDGDGQSATNDDIFDGLAPAANKAFPLWGSGAFRSPDRLIVAPRNYSGSASYITFRWKTGSGYTASGNPAGFARIKVVPCTVGRVACD